MAETAEVLCATRGRGVVLLPGDRDPCLAVTGDTLIELQADVRHVANLAELACGGPDGRLAQCAADLAAMVDRMWGHYVAVCEGYQRELN